MMEQDGFIGPVNIGNPDEFTIKELAEKVCALTGKKCAVRRVVAAADDPRQRKPDISLAKEKLGWEPAVNLDQGLTSTIEYFRNTLKEME